MSAYWVYILCSRPNGTLYIGVTSDLKRRVYEHKENLIEGFSKNYDITKLVYAEECGDIHDAIRREKALKKWNRAWKIRLIEEANPAWGDMYENI